MGVIKRLASAALLLFIASCSPITNAPKTQVLDFTISISDTNGKLLPHAIVTVDSVQKEANDFGWAYYTLQEGTHTLHIQKDGYKPTSNITFYLDRHTRVGIKLDQLAPPITRLTTDGRIFRQNGEAWRWKGVTAFGLQNRFCKGEDINPFLDAFKGFNVLRVFYYVEWEGTGWGVPSDDCVNNFLNYVGQRGWYVEMTAITGTKSEADAQATVDHIFQAFGSHTNLMVELVNEPHLYGKPNTSKINVNAGATLWASGDYDFSDGGVMRGSYGVAHTPRDNEWPRKAHDLLEYYNGGGPGSPSDPSHHFPQVADEPIRPDSAGYVASDFEAYFGVSSILGAGATFHFESGKYGQPPTPQEAVCAAAALRALDYFPADAPLGPYSRIDEGSVTLRTYKVGNYTVRVRPTDGGPILIK